MDCLGKSTVRKRYMVKFLETTGVSYELTQLIKNSSEKLWLISPYLQLNDQIKIHIKNRDNCNVDIRVIFREDGKINPDDMLFLQELTMSHIFACPNLHSKCYLNENVAIITSMNLYQYSQQNNKEMGIKIEKQGDPELYREVYEEANSIISSSTPFQFEIKKKTEESASVRKEPPKKVPTKQVERSESHDSGYCIRCGEKIKLDPNHPLCDKCYLIWAKFGDTKYQEKYCHACGKNEPSHKSSYEKPICYPCYKKLFK